MIGDRLTVRSSCKTPGQRAFPSDRFWPITDLAGTMTPRQAAMSWGGPKADLPSLAINSTELDPIGRVSSDRDQRHCATSTAAEPIRSSTVNDLTWENLPPSL